MKMNRQNLTYNVHPIAWQCGFRCFVTFLLWPPVKLQGFALFTQINSGLASYLKPKSRFFPPMKGYTEKNSFHLSYPRKAKFKLAKQRPTASHTFCALWLVVGNEKQQRNYIKSGAKICFEDEVLASVFAPFIILPRWQSFKRKCSQ